MTQGTLFDARESQAAKQEGMALAETASDKLALARQVAAVLGARYGRVDADMVGRILKNEYGIDSLGPAAGSLFRGGDWKWTGERRMSSRITNHRRELKVWQYYGA